MMICRNQIYHHFDASLCCKCKSVAASSPGLSVAFHKPCYTCLSQTWLLFVKLATVATLIEVA